MKKIKVIAIVLLVTFILTGCSMAMSLLEDYDEFAMHEELQEEMFQNIATELKERDKDGLKKLFAANALKEDDDFADSMEELFSYIDGDIISQSFEPVASVGGSSSPENGWEGACYECQGQFETETQTLYIAFQFRKGADDNKFDGLWSLYIMDRADLILDFPYWGEGEYIYWGDGQWTPGIEVAMEDYNLENLLEETDSGDAEYESEKESFLERIGIER